MPVICINPTNEVEAQIINKLSLQNQDLRVFVSNKQDENYIKECFRNCRDEIELFALSYLKGIFIE